MSHFLTAHRRACLHTPLTRRRRVSVGYSWRQRRRSRRYYARGGMEEGHVSDRSPPGGDPDGPSPPTCERIGKKFSRGGKGTLIGVLAAAGRLHQVHCLKKDEGGGRESERAVGRTPQRPTRTACTAPCFRDLARLPTLEGRQGDDAGFWLNGCFAPALLFESVSNLVQGIGGCSPALELL